MMTNPKEILTWIDADDKYPDAEKIILLFAPGHAVPVWLGYLDEEGEWLHCDGIPVDFHVVAWAEMPAGPIFNSLGKYNRICTDCDYENRSASGIMECVVSIRYEK